MYHVLGFVCTYNILIENFVSTGNRVLSYGGSISLRQKFNSDVYEKSERGTDVVLDGGDISIYWTNPNQFSSGVSYVCYYYRNLPNIVVLRSSSFQPRVSHG